MLSFRKWLSGVKRRFKSRQNRRRLLVHAPQRRGICRKVTWMAPKKPNSARRKISRIYVAAAGKATTVFIPGETHNLQAFSSVLIRGGRVQDLPGVNYKVIRGVYDCAGLPKRANARSKYGAKRSSRVKVSIVVRDVAR